MDEQQIKNQYRSFYRAAIAKDRTGMEAALDESFHLTHMTGMRQSRDEYIHSILRGTMNYFSEEPVYLEAKVSGNSATLLAQSRVEAAVFGGGRHTWRLQLDMAAEKKDGCWKFTDAAASTF